MRLLHSPLGVADRQLDESGGGGGSGPNRTRSVSAPSAGSSLHRLWSFSLFLLQNVSNDDSENSILAKNVAKITIFFKTDFVVS